MTIDGFSLWSFLGGMTAMAVPSMVVNEARIRHIRKKARKR